MNLLVATWDGAGNLPPMVAVTRALVDAGHEVHVLAHNVQRAALEATGASFIAYETAPQWDMARRVFVGEDRLRLLRTFFEASAADLLAVAARLAPDAVLLDCMMPIALVTSKRDGYPTVALVHGLYSFFKDHGTRLFGGGIDAADLALGLTYRAFETDVALPPNFHFVGPARPDLYEPPWPRRRPAKPFVLVSLSTGHQTDLQLPLLQRVCDALADLDVEALVCTGRGIAPEDLTPGPNTEVRRHAPHAAVLPDADLLITHGGHGTVAAGLRFGVPMLCLPPAADQPYNAARVADLGLGLALDPTSSSEEIRAAVETLLGDPGFKERSHAFADEVAGEPGLERAVELIEALAPRSVNQGA